MPDQLPHPDGYATWLGDLKERVRTTRRRASLAVNTEMLRLYWQIGRDLAKHQRTQSRGADVIARVSADLRAAIPDLRCLTTRGLAAMRAFAAAWPDPEIVEQTAALPWGHHQVLLDRLDHVGKRQAYAAAALEYGWSRAMLVHHINAETVEHSGLAVTDFGRTQPPPGSDLELEALTDPCRLELVGGAGDTVEPGAEELQDRVTRCLREHGVGLADVGRQVPLEVGVEDVELDLLFYHLGLRCYLVVSLETGPVTPELVERLDTYVDAVDDEMRHPHDRPGIGLLLCRSGDRVRAAYSLQGYTASHDVADHRLRAALPTVEQLQRALSADPTAGEPGRR